MRTERSASRTEDLAAAVREAIVGGELAPGQRLVEERLAARRGVSRIPVREVLRQLATEGFVDLVPNRGAVVASPSAGEIRSLFDVREAIEALLADRAARHRTAEHVAELRATVAAARHAIARDHGPAVLVALHARYYDTLAAAAGNLVAGQLLSQLRSRIRWVLAAGALDRAAAAWNEYEAVVDAVAARAPARAARLARTHLANARVAYGILPPTR